MFVEKWVYDYLRRPELDVIGDVLTDLSTPRTIDWIRLSDSAHVAAESYPRIASEIVVHGGCESHVLGVYFQAYAEKVQVHGNYVANGIRVGVNFAERLIEFCDRDVEEFRAESEILGLPLHLETGDLFGTATPNTLFVINFPADAHGTDRLRNKTHDWTMFVTAVDIADVRLPLSDTALSDSMNSPTRPLSKELRDHLVRVNRHLRDHYDIIKKPSETTVVAQTREVISRIPFGCKLIIIVDHDETRHSDRTNEIALLPWVTSYRAAIQALAAEYTYVAVVSISDVIRSPSEILGGSHYSREVYLRLVQRIVERANAIASRADTPKAKRPIARLIAAANESDRREGDTREFVQAGYECLLRRAPDEVSGDYFVNALATGSLSSAGFVRALTGTNEFKDKWRERGPAAVHQSPSPAPTAKLGDDDKIGREADARELVQAGYECLMRRPPDTGSGDYFVNALVTGGLSAAAFVRALTGTNEFKDKWTERGHGVPQSQSASSSVPPSKPGDGATKLDRMNEEKVSTLGLIDPRVLRAPDDLLLIATHPKRALIVGSCLSEGWALRMRALPNPCESDVYLLGRDLPEQPERPISDYDFQLVQLALRFVLPDASFARLSEADVGGHERLFTHAVNGMRRYLDGAMRWNRKYGILTFVFPFLAPQQNAVGRLMPRYDLRNPVYFIEKLNEALAKSLEAYRNVYFFDLNEVHSSHGRRYVQEDMILAINHGSYLSDFDYDHDQNRLEVAEKATDLFEARSFEVFTAAWQELISLNRSIRQADAIKLVVIDLDDTLWRGVIAESDPESMPTSEGWPKGFWEALLFLKRRGILLAILSKNEDSRVVEAWDKLVAGQLKLEDFASRRINWRPKPDNMAEILAQVNLLPGNVLYIDDNPAERAAMKGAFPDIRVLGGTPLAWRRILLWSSETQVANITAESVARTDMMRAQVVREEQRAKMSREQFLASLNVRMMLFEVQNAEHPRFPRVFELINKTNQFNTTGKRWTREECVAAFASGTAFYAFEVADHYTEYGLVGVLIVDATGIRQFVMSCRIMGLEAEVAALAKIGALLREGGATTLFAAMIETDRNQPCRDLYSRCGFEAVKGGWRRGLEPWFEAPSHIALTVERAKTGKTMAAAAE